MTKLEKLFFYNNMDCTGMHFKRRFLLFLGFIISSLVCYFCYNYLFGAIQQTIQFEGNTATLLALGFGVNLMLLPTLFMFSIGTTLILCSIIDIIKDPSTW